MIWGLEEEFDEEGWIIEGEISSFSFLEREPKGTEEKEEGRWEKDCERKSF